jgi:hypothetical protein
VHEREGHSDYVEHRLSSFTTGGAIIMMIMVFTLGKTMIIPVNQYNLFLFSPLLSIIIQNIV